MSFVHLQCQTMYSLLKSTCRIEELVKAAKEMGFQALAITDENVMYGAIPFYQACLREGVQPIIGLTASVWNETDGKAYPLVLLAENEAGYQNLLKISSAIMTKSKEGIPKKWLARYAEGLIAISPGPAGEIEQAVLRRDYEAAKSAVRQYQLLFAAFYLSIQNHDTAAEYFLYEQLRPLAAELDVPFVAANDVRYVKREEAFVHECLLAIESGTKMVEEGRPRLETDEYYLKSSAEMNGLFAHLPEALRNTEEIAGRCRAEITFHTNRLPRFPVPAGETSDSYLRRLCEDGLAYRYEEVQPLHRERLQHELDVICRMGFSDYFLIVADFMKYAHDNGILTGPGRGSAAGSLVAYVLRITDVDPIQYHLLFERFLNPERVTLPDIDIDFPDIRRDEVIRYTAEKYGTLHVAQIITFGTLAAKAAMRDTARALGLSQREMDLASRLIPSRLGITLREAYEESQGLREWVQSQSRYERVFQIACQVEGLPRHTSIHAAGVVLSDTPLTEQVAVQEGHNGVYVTQYAAEALEALGLLKMDFLGLRNLTMLESIRRLAEQTSGGKISLAELPLEDEATFALLGRGETSGIFQLESEGMRKVLSSLQPTEFEDIVAVNALYRPGPMEQIPIFIEAKHGKRAIQYPHPDLEPILQNTYGVIVYQEQIMQIASRLAGFSLGEADLLRRAISKKNRDVLDRERRHFVEGCLRRGYEEATANAVYDLIVQFANYGFNRSHAVAYSMIAYQLAYFKANYPQAFMTALLSSVLGNEERTVQYIRESRRYGIQVLPPSVQRSGYTFRLEGDSIRCSLTAIRGIGTATVKAIVEERRKRPFADMFDFCVRLPQRLVNEKLLETLILAGCFDESGQDRAVLLASMEPALSYAALVRPEGEGELDMLDLVSKPRYAEAAPFPLLEKLQREKEVLGLYLSGYPTAAYEALMRELSIPALSEIRPGRQTVRSIVLVSRVSVIRTKKLQNMAFLTISDGETEMEAVLFPEAHIQFGGRVQENALLLLEGAVSVRNGKLQWVVSGVYPLDESAAYEPDRSAALYIKLPSQHEKASTAKIRSVLLQHPGFAVVRLYFEKENKLLQLPASFSVHPEKACLEALQEIAGVGNVVCKKR
ncbi:DNA polymerase III subunit alpha [Ectobacillus ponti]|uniref:DNA polymerase III subunit alpha n=1 Tax=Ectobacillus ponti TaxID=2961894 RepID=A0AA42BRJ2_9BACI|nr:DNA polymerase III subunit alpha [Ectobacillus ponti]MCP8967438.1 DNA polymerase III subunit alpha [Ectobacillus ponti]